MKYYEIFFAKTVFNCSACVVHERRRTREAGPFAWAVMVWSDKRAARLFCLLRTTQQA